MYRHCNRVRFSCLFSLNLRTGVISALRVGFEFELFISIRRFYGGWWSGLVLSREIASGFLFRLLDLTSNRPPPKSNMHSIVFLDELDFQSSFSNGPNLICTLQVLKCSANYTSVILQVTRAYLQPPDSTSFSLEIFPLGNHRRCRSHKLERFPHCAVRLKSF